MNDLITDMTDEDLCSLSDAIHAEEFRRDHLSDPNRAKWLASLTDEELRDMSGRTSDEEYRRAEALVALQASHEAEQGDAREDSGTPTNRQAKLTHRCARLFKLARLNAPEVVIAHALGLVLKVAPKPVMSFFDEGSR